MTDLFARALASHQAGDLDQAESLYRQCLDRSPDHADSLHLFGVLHHQRGQHDKAADLIRRAIARDGSVASYHGHLGLVLQAMGQLEEAVSHQRRALELHPGQFEASFNLALALVALGRPSEAVVHYAEAVRQNPDSPDAVLNYGAVLQDLGQMAEAMEMHQRAAQLMPADPRPWSNMMLAFISLGRPDLAARAEEEAIARGAPAAPANRALLLAAQANALRQQGRLNEAAEQFYQAIRLDGRSASLLNDFALTMSDMGQAEDALKLFDGALAVDPSMAIAWNNRGNALNRQGDRDRAFADWMRAVALDPSRPEVWTNIANGWRAREDFARSVRCHHHAMRLAPANATVCNNLGHALQGDLRFAEAAEHYRKALALNPAYAEAWSNLGLASQRLGRADDALRMFEHALTLSDDMPMVRFNRGLLRLEAGNIGEGLVDYGWRFLSGQIGGNRQPPVPAWRGEDPSDLRIMVWGEQGVGDVILFASILPDLIAQARQVVIEIDRRMVPLFQRSFPQAVVRPLRDDIPGQAIDYDRHVPIGSLMRVYRDRLGKFPGNPHWLVADAGLCDRWKQRLDALPDGLRVGIGWRSQLRTAERNASYVELTDLRPLLTMPELVIVNLQYGAVEDEIRAVEDELGVTIHRWPDLDLRDDFEGTAALMRGLDLVISPAISVGEMASALGVPVWRFGHCDWTSLGTVLRPFHPAQRQFRVGGKFSLAGLIDRMVEELVLLRPDGNAPVLPVVKQVVSKASVDWDARLSPLVAGPRIGIHWRDSLLSGDGGLWPLVFRQPGLCLIALRGSDGDADRIRAEAVYDCCLQRWADDDSRTGTASDDDLLRVLDLVISDDPAVCQHAETLGVPVLLLTDGLVAADIASAMDRLLAEAAG